MGDSICFITGAHIDLTARLFAPPVIGASNPGSVTARPGGAGLNSASTAAALGATTMMASPVGRDPHGQTLRTTLAERGIGDFLVEIDNVRTGTYTAIIAPDGSMLIGVADLAMYEAVSAQWFFDHCENALARAGTWFFNANLPASTLADLASRAGERRIAAATISPAKAPRLAPVLHCTDYLFTNLAEARTLCSLPQADAPQLCAALARSGVKSGIISAGSGSLHWWNGSASGTLQPPPVEAIVDVNGAGDALAATVLCALQRGEDFETSVRLGMAAAQLTLSRPDPWYRGLSWPLLHSRLSITSAKI